MYAIIFHGHQKLDRVAHRHLSALLPKAFFPSAKQILSFEAGRGPDGTRLKRHKVIEQPWHFLDPDDTNDIELTSQIEHHYSSLVKALVGVDDIRAAFEAAWLAHAIVDGLTPAHHYPYEQELSEIRGGQQRHTRKGLIGRGFVKGESIRESFKKSMKVVGPHGLLTSHMMFEAGAFMLIEPLKLKDGLPSSQQCKEVQSRGVVSIFNEIAQEIAEMDIYLRFCKIGWTQTISQDVRRELAPRIVRMITLAWYAACIEAKGFKK